MNLDDRYRFRDRSVMAPVTMSRGRLHPHAVLWMSDGCPLDSRPPAPWAMLQAFLQAMLTASVTYPGRASMGSLTVAVTDP
jgi:hypothetical protein